MDQNILSSLLKSFAQYQQRIIFEIQELIFSNPSVLQTLKNVFVYLFVQTAFDVVREVCQEMGLNLHEEHSEYGLFSLMEDRKYFVENVNL